LQVAQQVLGAPSNGMKSYQKILNSIVSRPERLEVERQMLRSLGFTLKTCIQILEIRDGILLMALKAHNINGDYEEQAIEKFPDYPDRQRLSVVEKSKQFLKENGVQLKDGADAAFIDQIEGTWSLEKIISVWNKPLNSSADNLPDGQQSNSDAVDGIEKSDEPKKPKSKFIRIDTLRQQIKRFGDKATNLFTSFKRMNPDDFEKARDHMEKHIPEFLQGALSQAVKEVLRTTEKKNEVSNEE
jgi:hypothetical protein